MGVGYLMMMMMMMMMMIGVEWSGDDRVIMMSIVIMDVLMS